MDSDSTFNSQIALDHLVSRAGQLYSLPAVALEVLELTQRSLVDLRALKDCIENDPALTSKVLRVVNSALFGLSGEVTDLNHALTLLGIKPLKLLVLGFSLSDAMFSKLTGRWIGRYWRHTLTKAVATRELSESVWRIPADEPFLIALLQDLGLLVMLQELGEPFAALLERVWAADGDLMEIERATLGFDHRELTSRMLAAWGLPQQLVAGVLADRDDAADFSTGLPAHQALPHVLRMAELLADLLAEGRPRALQALLALETMFPMSREQVLGLVDRTHAKVDALAEVFSLELPDSTDHRHLLHRAHDQLARVAEAAAIELLSSRRRLQGGGAEVEEALLGDAQELTAALRQAVERAARSANEEQTAPTPVRRAHGPAKTLPSPVSKRAVAVEAIDSSIDDDPQLYASLAAAVAACRQSRASLSLALVELDGFARLEREFGALRAETVIEAVAARVSHFDAPAKMVFRVRKTRFALVLPGWERQQASEFHHQCMASLVDVLVESPDGQLGPASVSIGLASVAQPAKNFEPRSLLESATRCLAAAQRSGGGTMKSIGIY
jgi:HD-like signal output (HDOD) protein/GGDEF domain-containing protein